MMVLVFMAAMLVILIALAAMVRHQRRLIERLGWGLRRMGKGQYDFRLDERAARRARPALPALQRHGDASGGALTACASCSTLRPSCPSCLKTPPRWTRRLRSVQPRDRRIAPAMRRRLLDSRVVANSPNRDQVDRRALVLAEHDHRLARSGDHPFLFQALHDPPGHLA
jgi:hypothetical protein